MRIHSIGTPGIRKFISIHYCTFKHWNHTWYDELFYEKQELRTSKRTTDSHLPAYAHSVIS